jgi:hypothetical protein
MYQKRASDPFKGGCEPPCGCWDLNTGPSEEQSVLLPTEPPHQPPHMAIYHRNKEEVRCILIWSSIFQCTVQQKEFHWRFLSASKAKDPNTDLQKAIITKSRVASFLHGDRHCAWLLREEARGGPDKAGLLFLKEIFIDIIWGGGGVIFKFSSYFSTGVGFFLFCFVLIFCFVVLFCFVLVQRSRRSRLFYVM